jgi:hypothetical protein
VTADTHLLMLSSLIAPETVKRASLPLIDFPIGYRG